MAQDDGIGTPPPATPPIGTSPSGDAGYAVGYGKPPLQTRFRKGRSGNPLGRPRRKTDLASLLARALDRPAVAEGRRAGTQREAIVAALVEQSASGDLRATKLVFELMRQAGPAAAPSAALAAASAAGVAAAPDDDPRQILLRRLARLADDGGGTEAA